MFCENCGANDQVGKFCGKCGSPLTEAPAAAAPQVTAAPSAAPVVVGSARQLYEYMVLTQKDRVFGGKFNPLQLQEALNGFARQGWRVVEAATTTFPGFSGNREEIVFILERPVG
jgi:NADH pyrophosphatase NudC (nudix superfamily)